jgi:hypothetical protein
MPERGLEVVPASPCAAGSSVCLPMVAPFSFGHHAASLPLRGARICRSPQGRSRSDLAVPGRCLQAVRRWGYARRRRSCRRELMPSLENTLCRWYSAVRGLMNSSAPISAFVWPSAASRAICAFLHGVRGRDGRRCGCVRGGRSPPGTRYPQPDRRSPGRVTGPRCRVPTRCRSRVFFHRAAGERWRRPLACQSGCLPRPVR